MLGFLAFRFMDRAGMNGPSDGACISVAGGAGASRLIVNMGAAVMWLMKRGDASWLTARGSSADGAAAA